MNSLVGSNPNYLKSLTASNLSSKALRHLLKGLQSNYCIKTLNLSRNSFSESKWVSQICKILVENDSVQHLDLSHSNISDQAAESLCYLLENSLSLKSVNLSHNQLTDTNLGISVANNQVLEELDLSGNPFSYEAFAEVLDMLTLNSSLKTLKISEVNLVEPSETNLTKQDQIEFKLAYVLKYSRIETLHISISPNSISLKELKNTLSKHNKTLKHLVVPSVNWNEAPKDSAWFGIKQALQDLETSSVASVFNELEYSESESEEVKPVENNYTQLEELLEDLEKRLSVLEKKESGKVKLFEELGNEVCSLREYIRDLEYKIDCLEFSLQNNQVNSDISEVQSQLKFFENSLKEVSKLKENFEKQHSQTLDLKTEFYETKTLLNKKVETLENKQVDLVNLKSLVNNFQAEVEMKVAEAKPLDFTNLENSVKHIQTRLVSLEYKLDPFKLSNLTERVSFLEKEIQHTERDSKQELKVSDLKQENLPTQSLNERIASLHRKSKKLSK